MSSKPTVPLTQFQQWEYIKPITTGSLYPQIQKGQENPTNSSIIMDSKSPSILSNVPQTYPYKVYFNWDQNLPCIKTLFNSMMQKYKNIRFLKWEGENSRPCIMFNFIAVVSRIDHNKFVQQSETWKNKAGTSVVIRVHSHNSQSFNDDSLDNVIYSNYNSQKKILKWRFLSQLDNTGINNQKQVLQEQQKCEEQLHRLILEAKL